MRAALCVGTGAEDSERLAADVQGAGLVGGSGGGQGGGTGWPVEGWGGMAGQVGRWGGGPIASGEWGNGPGWAEVAGLAGLVRGVGWAGRVRASMVEDVKRTATQSQPVRAQAPSKYYYESRNRRLGDKTFNFSCISHKT